MNRGIAYGFAAGALWGLSYLMPLVVPSFTSLELAIARYFCYGVFSLAFVSSLKTVWSWRIWSIALLYALIGNVVYYTLVVMSVRIVGADIVALLFALVPVLITGLGNLISREYPFAILFAPTMLIALGLVCVHWNEVVLDKGMDARTFWTGVTIGMTAILMWTGYAIHNAHVLKREQQLDARELSVAVGVCCFFCSVLMAIICAYWAPDQLSVLAGTKVGSDWLRIAIAGLLLGPVVSFLGTDFWNRAARMLPVSLAGQLVVAEVLCGLLYVYIWNQHLPGRLEVAGVLCTLSGVTMGLQRIHAYKPSLQCA